jgi:hypothetical protein
MVVGFDSAVVFREVIARATVHCEGMTTHIFQESYSHLSHFSRICTLPVVMDSSCFVSLCNGVWNASGIKNTLCLQSFSDKTFTVNLSGHMHLRECILQALEKIDYFFAMFFGEGYINLTLLLRQRFQDSTDLGDPHWRMPYVVDRIDNTISQIIESLRTATTTRVMEMYPEQFDLRESSQVSAYISFLLSTIKFSTTVQAHSRYEQFKPNEKTFPNMGSTSASKPKTSSLHTTVKAERPSKLLADTYCRKTLFKSLGMKKKNGTAYSTCEPQCERQHIRYPNDVDKAGAIKLLQDDSSLFVGLKNFAIAACQSLPPKGKKST